MAISMLITGVSGYIGGSVLSALLDRQSKGEIQLGISAQVRSEEQAARIQSLGQGVRSIIVPDFDELEQLQKLGEQFDIIIHAGAGWHTSSAKAFIRGLSVRKSAGKSAHYIQISGTSNLSDRPHSENFVETHTFSDEEDIYAYEISREAKEAYYQRTTDVAVVEAGEELKVPTYIVMAPTIFGVGKGLFNVFSVQLPAIIADTLQSQEVKVIGNGETVWTHIHIDDLTDLFVLIVQRIVDGADIPSGRRGIYFCESGEHTHLEMARRLVDAAVQLGLAHSSEVNSVSVNEAADAFAGGNTARVELSFGANARCKAVLARKLGWKPGRESEWPKTFAAELREYAERKPQPKVLPSVMKKKAT